MFQSFRKSRLTIAAFSCASLGLGIATQAQTAPQLVPYTARLIAGSGTVAIAKGAACPVSGGAGNVSTDAYGDGCLATEVQLGAAATGGPRYAVADKNGNIFFGDFVNGLVRRVDAQTGIITAVAGGATASPAVGATCGTGVSISSDGDGCPANLVKLGKPAGVAFDSAGNLYFTDNSFDNIRRIAADPTTGLITTTGTITHIAGNTTYGYSTNNGGTVPQLAATAYLNFPYGLAFDTSGNLYVADEGNNAISVINMGLTPRVIQGFTVPAGTIQKISGWGNLQAKTANSGECPNFISTTTRGGCYFGKWTDGAIAATTNNDAVYSVAVDPTGNVYFANEFNNNVGFITPANIISTYAGIQGTAAKNLKSRGTAGSFGIGSIFGVALDQFNNLYVTDASSGAIWRVDAANKAMYAIAGGGAAIAAGATCGTGTATDTLGDGCPALLANFGSSGSGNFASTALPGPGIYGISADTNGNVFFGDTENFTVREVASGTQFGQVGVNQSVTDVLDIHFVAGDGPAASGAYTLTSGTGIFTLGTATCTTNTPDGTTDCLLPVTATPTAIGAFSGSLTVKSNSSNGGTSTFALSGIGVTSPVTRTALTVTNPGSTCTGTTYSTTAALTLTATITATGPVTGTVTFYDGSTQIGTPQTVASNKATLSYAFSTAGTHSITAVYSGDGTYYRTSTSTPVSITTSTPSFSVAAVTDSAAASPGCPAGMVGKCTVPQGGTALYSFKITQSVYAGTISFACSGLPANSSCVFSPATLAASACDTGNVVAVSVLTTAPTVKASQAGFAGGRLPLGTSLFGVLLACAVGLRRRRAAMRFGQLWMVLALLLAASGMVACGKGAIGSTATPTGTSTVTITATGSTGTSSSFSVPLIVQ